MSETITNTHIENNSVYTPEPLVTKLIDLVAEEMQRIDSKILEPGCGTGNFLCPILARKLEIVEKSHSRSRIDFEYYILRTVMSLYGIEIKEDTLKLCKTRLTEDIRTFYLKHYSEAFWKGLSETVKYILDCNIVCGDALTLKDPITEEPIVFPEWSFLNNYRVKRRDFIYENLIEQSKNTDKITSDSNTEEYIVNPIKDFPIKNIFKIKEYDQL